MSRVIIFANGLLPELEKALRLLHPDDLIVCADGGTQHAFALGLLPDLVIGDLDSLSSDQRQTLEQQNVRFETYSSDKNETDLELAIQYTLNLNPNEVVILGALGGRLDQTLGNIALLAGASTKLTKMRLDDGVEEILFCRAQVEIRGEPGEIVSLLPWGGTVEGVQTTGLKWPLNREPLYPDKTRGISNEMESHEASVSIESGTLLVVHQRHV